MAEIDNIANLKSEAYDLVMEKENMTYAYNQRVKMIIERLNQINSQIAKETDVKKSKPKQKEEKK